MESICKTSSIYIKTIIAMAKKQIIRLINEEISGFDYLNQEQLQEEDNVENVLKSKDFQTKLVHDMMNSFNNTNIFKNKEVIEQSSNVEELEPDSVQGLNIEYIVDFIYNYQGKDMPISVIIEGNDIWQDLHVDRDSGDYYTPPSVESKLDFDWMDINSKIMYDGEVEVELDWLYKNKDIYRKFLERFVGHLVEV
jgi:hypothetical protein